MKLHHRLACLFLIALSSLTGCISSSTARNSSMDKTGWITHCFGRFLIDLPPDADIKAGYYLWGDGIDLLKDPSLKLEKIITQREQELRSEKNIKTQRSRFIRTINLAPGKGVLSWESNYSTEMYLLDTYVISKPAGNIYHWAAGVTKSRENQGLDSASILSRSIRSLEPNEIPTEPGFCIDRAYIAGNSYQGERFDIGVTFPDRPGAHFEFSSSTGAEQDRLLDRAGGFLMGVAKRVAGIETLRKRERPGAVPAEEFLVAGSHQGQRLYTFAWEAQGKDGSITEPNITAGLEVGESYTDANGKLPRPPFKSDKEALDLWDTIIDSIRLRPVTPNLGGSRDIPPSHPGSPAAKHFDQGPPVGYELEEFLTTLPPLDNWMDDL